MKKIILFLFFAILFTQSNAQRGIVLSIVPQYLINYGIRIDTDVQLKRGWLVVSPQIYYANKNEFKDDYYGYTYESRHYQTFYRLRGLGLDFSYRRYFRNTTPKGAYAALGVCLQHYSLRYSATIYRENQEDELNYLIAENGYKEQKIFKGGIKAMAGYQFFWLGKLSIDLYAGFSYQLASYKNADARKYSNIITDYGFAGPQIIGGIRFGARLQ